MSADATRPVLERLVRLETNLDVSTSSYADHFADHEARLRALEREKGPGAHDDHETRIRRLERSWWRLTGAAAAVGGVLGSIVGPLLGG
jgi:hypothetical protein